MQRSSPRPNFNTRSLLADTHFCSKAVLSSDGLSEKKKSTEKDRCGFETTRFQNHHGPPTTNSSSASTALTIKSPIRICGSSNLWVGFQNLRVSWTRALHTLTRCTAYHISECTCFALFDTRGVLCIPFPWLGLAVLA